MLFILFFFCWSIRQKQCLIFIGEFSIRLSVSVFLSFQKCHRQFCSRVIVLYSPKRELVLKHPENEPHFSVTLLFLWKDVPKLQPHPGLEKHEEEEEEEEDGEGGDDGGKKKLPPDSKTRVQSGPRTPNPYAADNSSLMFPILVAFGVFIPTLFCLCRLWDDWTDTTGEGRVGGGRFEEVNHTHDSEEIWTHGGQ